MKSMRSIFCFLLIVSMPSLCASKDNGSSDPSASSTADEVLAADALRTTVDGNNFMVPAGWSLRTAGSAVILTAPEGGSHIALVDVAQLLRFVDDPTTDCAEVDALIDSQLTRVRARLDTLQMLERQLVALRNQCGAPDRAAQCGILHELEAPTRGDVCVCHDEHAQ